MMPRHMTQPRTTCLGCAAPMVRNGRRTVRYADLRLGKAVMVEAKIQRHACRSCGMDFEEQGPPLRPGFRMTQTLWFRIAAASAVSSLTSVAAGHGIDRSTVEGVWSDWISGRRSIGTRPRDALVRSIRVGRFPVLAAVNTEGRLLAAFGGASDPFLAAWFDAGSGGDLFCDLGAASILSRLGAGNVRIAIRRADVVDWLEGWLPEAVGVARGSLDPREKRVLSDCRAVVLKPKAARTDEEDFLIGEAGRKVPYIRELDLRISSLRRVFATSDRHVAAARFGEWANLGGAFSQEVFRCASATIGERKEAIFGEGYSSRDRAFPPRSFRIPTGLEADGRKRAVGRFFALNHDATARTILDLDLGPSNEQAVRSEGALVR
jgi:hypothetical protein